MALAGEKGRSYSAFALLLLVVAELGVFYSKFAGPLIFGNYRNDWFSVTASFFLFTLYSKGLFGLAVIFFAKLSDYRALILGQHSNQYRHLMAHIVSVAILYGVLRQATGIDTGSPSDEPAWLIFLFIATLLSSAASALLMLAPIQFWRRFAREQKWGILTLLACIALYGLLSRQLINFDAQLAAIMFQPTAQVVALLDNLFGFHVLVDATARILAVDGFSVEVGYPCLGYQGMSLVFLFLGAYIYFARGQLKFPNVLLAIPLAMVAMLLLNTVRIALLMAIGASWSPEIAIQGFHSVAGWWNLMAVVLVSIISINRFSWFNRLPANKIFHFTGENILLLPQLALIAVSLATLLFTATFDWLYPVRVIVVGAILLHFRSSLQLGIFRPGLVAMSIGLIIFLMWIAIVPASEEKSLAFSTALFSAPWAGAACWIVFRIIGAVIIVPYAEELAFRGFLLAYCEQALSSFSSPVRLAGATLITSVAFGALHSSLLAGTLAGVGFAVAKYYRGQLSDAITAHVTANLLLSAYVLAGGDWSYW